MAESKIDIVVSTPGAEAAARLLQNLGDQGYSAFGKVHGAAKEAAEGGLAALQKATELGEERMREFAGTAGGLGQILSALGPGGLAGAAGLGAIYEVSKELVTAGAAAELQMAKINAVLAATGSQSGKTADDIEEMANRLATTTLASKDQVMQAAAVLASFGGVAGDVFDKTLEAAQDLSAVGFGDLTSAAQKLGRMLEDPANNLDALKRVGISFTTAQKDLIKSLEDTGDHAGAVEIILDRIHSKVGGAGAATGDTLSGAWHGLTQEFDIFVEHTAAGQGNLDVLRAWIESVTGSLKTLTAGPIEQAEKQLVSLQAKLAEAQKSGTAPSNSLAAQRFAVGQPEAASQIEQEIAALEKRISVLKAEADTDKALAEIASQSAADQAAADKLEAGSHDLLLDALDRLKKSSDEYFTKQDQERSKRADLITTLGVEADKQERMAVAVTQGGAAVDKLNLQLEIEANLRKLGADASPEEIQAVIDKTTAIHYAADSIRDYNQALADQQSAEDKAAAAAERAAEKMAKQAELVQRTLGQEAQKGADAVIQSLVNMADGAKNPLDAFKKYVITTFEQTAAASFIRPIIQPVFASALGAVGNGILSSGAAAAAGGGGYGSVAGGAGSAALFAGYGSQVSDAINTFGANYLGTAVGPDALAAGGTSLTGLLGGAGLGALGGNIITSLYGGNKTVGSIGGAVTGALLASGNLPLAGIAAAVTVLGSLFGPKMSNNTGVSNLDLATGAYSANAGDPRKVDQANISAAGQLSSTLETFVQFLTGEAGKGVQGRTFFEVGSRDGITANVVGQSATFANTDAGAAQAIGFAVKQVAQQLGSALPKEIADALDKVDFSSTQAVQTALSQLQTVKSFVDLQKQIANIGKPGDTVADSWNNTIAQISTLAEQVKALGVDADEANGLVETFKENFRANYIDSQTRTLNQVSGQGFLNSLGDAVKQHGTDLSDASLLGISPDLANKIFAATIKSILGGMTQDQLDTVSQAFGNVPEILAAVADASSALTTAADAQKAAADAATAAAAAQQAQQQAQADALQHINDLYTAQTKQIGNEISTLQAAAQGWSKIADGLSTFGSGLLIDPSLSPLGLGSQVDTARAQMLDLFNKGMGGDQGAATQFQTVAKSFLTLDKQFNASNATYAADFQMVEGMSTKLGAYASAQVSVAQQQLDVLNAILVAIQNEQAAVNGKTPSSTAGNSAAYGKAVTSAFGSALAASGMSAADFLNSDQGSVWIKARNDLIASTTDPSLLSADYKNAVDQMNQPGMQGVGAGYVAAVVAQMNKAGVPIPGFGNVGQSVPAFAEGGIATRPTLAYVAEAGNAEAMIPLKGGSVPVSLGAIGPKLDRLAAAVEDLAAVSTEGHTRTISALRLIVDNTRDAAAAPLKAAQLGATSARRRMLGSAP